MKTILCSALLLIMLAGCATPATSIPPRATPSVVPTLTPMPTPTIRIAQATEAIVAAQQMFPQLKEIKPTPAGTIGATTNISTQERADGWNIIFWQGDGDCPAGCINNHYWYVAVNQNGEVSLAGEYSRTYDSNSNTMQTTGAPLWGVPK